MLGYITIGSNDPRAAAEFFDPIFAMLHGDRAYSLDHMIAYRFGSAGPLIVVTRPYDGKAASVGNGVMIALEAKDRATVDAVHNQALALGAVDEGTPGPRGTRFYGGYFRDPQGNKFNVHVSE